MRLSKFEIAKRILEVAAQLYVEGGDYLAVLHLAGASEEIFANLLRRAHKKAMIHDLIDLDRELSGGRDFNVVNEEVNGARNAIKHARRKSEDEVFVEQRQAAAMLARALVNFARLDGEPSNAIAHACKKLLNESPREPQLCSERVIT